MCVMSASVAPLYLRASPMLRATQTGSSIRQYILYRGAHAQSRKRISVPFERIFYSSITFDRLLYPRLRPHHEKKTRLQQPRHE
jgi:hypothetical protein